MATPVGVSASQTGAAEWSSTSIPAEDMIDFFKIVACPQTGNHNWSTCFCAHPNEKARRRSLAEHSYHAIFCVEMLSKGHCKSGDDCNLSHSVFEYWVHPEKFRTKFCKDGPDCKRAVCFFAHSRHELREPCPEYKARRVTDSISQQIQELAQSLSLTPDRSNSQGQFSLSSPGSQSSSTTMQYSPGVANIKYVMPETSAAAATAAAAGGHQCCPVAVPAVSGAGQNVPVYIVSSNSSTAGVAAMQQQSCFSNVRLLPAQQVRPSGVDNLSSLQVMQPPPMIMVSAQAANQLAALQLRYDQLVNKAEVAAARAEAATVALHTTVAALGGPATIAAPDTAATLSTSIPHGRPTPVPAGQQAQTATSSSVVEAPAVAYIPQQQQLSTAGSGDCQQGLAIVTDPTSLGGVSYTVTTPVNNAVPQADVPAPASAGHGVASQHPAMTIVWRVP